MAKPRRALGTGLPSQGGPAPRQLPDIDTLTKTADDLRELLREARGVLSDLARERKAIEQLARDRAQEAIETHVNACIKGLETHIHQQINASAAEINKSFKGLLDKYLYPDGGAAFRADPDRGKRVGMPEVMAAARTIADSMVAPPEVVDGDFLQFVIRGEQVITDSDVGLGGDDA